MRNLTDGVYQKTTLLPHLEARSPRVMDGMHRVCKALKAGMKSILTVRIETNPESDVPFLQSIERRVTSEEVFSAARRENRLWVARTQSGEVIGFALVLMLDGLAHLKELAVLPDHGRRGAGTSLVRTVCQWAEDHAIPSVTLSTFREVEWNGPFYSRLGFRIVRPGASAGSAGVDAIQVWRWLAGGAMCIIAITLLITPIRR